jgi:hypothetical protein
MKLITLDDVFRLYRDMRSVVNHDHKKMMTFGQFCDYISQGYRIV